MEEQMRPFLYSNELDFTVFYFIVGQENYATFSNVLYFSWIAGAVCVNMFDSQYISDCNY